MTNEITKDIVILGNFIKEEEYQKIKKKINKDSDYFSLEELNVYNLSKKDNIL